MEYGASLNRLVPDGKARESAGTAQDPAHKIPVRYWSSKFRTTRSSDLKFRALLTENGARVIFCREEFDWLGEDFDRC
jgi:hypothetical protein